jgi:microsomal prostaglandin-E synthase 2
MVRKSGKPTTLRQNLKQIAQRTLSTCLFYRSKDYRKVPIASLEDKVWKGSDTITDGLLAEDFVLENLEKKWKGTNMTIDRFRQDDGWLSFTNDKLAALMYPNICRTLSDSYLAFSYVNNVESFSWFQRQSIRALGSLAMNVAASKVKSTYTK